MDYIAWVKYNICGNLVIMPELPYNIFFKLNYIARNTTLCVESYIALITI